MVAKIRFLKVTDLPNRLLPNAVYFVQKADDTETEMYVTSQDRVPHLVNSKNRIMQLIRAYVGARFHIGDEPPEDTTMIWIDTSNL